MDLPHYYVAWANYIIYQNQLQNASVVTLHYQYNHISIKFSCFFVCLLGDEIFLVFYNFILLSNILYIQYLVFHCFEHYCILSSLECKGFREIDYFYFLAIFKHRSIAPLLEFFDTSCTEVSSRDWQFVHLSRQANFQSFIFS